MRKITFILVAIVFLLNACSEETNELPTCSITEPVNGSEILKGEIVTISALAEDTDGDIIEVEYYIDNSLIGTVDSVPFNLQWNSTDSENKDVTIKAIAKDNSGGSIYDEISVSVNRYTGTISDYDGNIYNTVKIGEQWWMAENLRTTHYLDGTEITLIEDNAEWPYNLPYNENAISAYCYYDNSVVNAETYGALYSGFTVVEQSKNICPDGWHVANNEDWTELFEYLASVGYSEKEGKALKSKSLWVNDEEGNDGNGTDNFGFNAVPSGFRSAGFVGINMYADFWSATEMNDTFGWWVHLSRSSEEYSIVEREKTWGFSVRCVKD